jgi:hypothetical protein
VGDKYIFRVQRGFSGGSQKPLLFEAKRGHHHFRVALDAPVASDGRTIRSLSTVSTNILQNKKEKENSQVICTHFASDVLRCDDSSNPYKIQYVYMLSCITCVCVCVCMNMYVCMYECACMFACMYV